MKKQILTTKEVASMLNKHEQTIYRWARKKVIPSHKVEGALFFDLHEIKDRVLGKHKSKISHIGVDSCL